MREVIDSELFEEVVAARRDLHRHPELSWEEWQTADRVCAFLDRHGIAYRRDVAGTGVIAEIGAGDGADGRPVVALRADMDALPITEETGLPFASCVEGRMHACGHDAHMSMVLGAGVLLRRAPSLPATIRLIFQPAEETGQGADAMIAEGVLDDVAMIFGGHVDRHFPAGMIAVTDGPVNASTDSFRIRLHGRGAHAARPHEGVDAVIVGTLVVSTLQTIVSREINPAHPSVVTVGRFEAGTAANVIASSAVLEGTVRAQEVDVRNQLVAAVERIARGAAQLHGAEVEFEVVASTPPVVNPPDTTAIARDAALRVVGSSDVGALELANMGAEDFGRYVERVRGCYVRFGSRVPGHEGYPAHSSRFDVDESALGIGAAYFNEVARLAAEHVADGRVAADAGAGVRDTEG